MSWLRSRLSVLGFRLEQKPCLRTWIRLNDPHGHGVSAPMLCRPRLIGRCFRSTIVILMVW